MHPHVAQLHHISMAPVSQNIDMALILLSFS